MVGEGSLGGMGLRSGCRRALVAGEGSLVGLSFWSDIRGSVTLGTMDCGGLMVGVGLCLRVGIEDKGLSFWPGTTCSPLRGFS